MALTRSAFQIRAFRGGIVKFERTSQTAAAVRLLYVPTTFICLVLLLVLLLLKDY
jgi:hypothetical protein